MKPINRCLPVVLVLSTWCFHLHIPALAQNSQPPAPSLTELRTKAEQGDANAQNNLGNMYDEGRGVTKDEVEAVNWYRKAADQGDALAQVNLGLMYAEGRGVAKDAVEGYAWLNLAATTFQPAVGRRDSLASKMSPDQIFAAYKRTRELRAQIEDNIQQSSTTNSPR